MTNPLTNRAGKLTTLAAVIFPPALRVVPRPKVKSNIHCVNIRVKVKFLLRTTGHAHIGVVLQYHKASQTGWHVLESFQEFCGPAGVVVGGILSCDTDSSTDDGKKKSGELHGGQYRE